MRLRGDAIREGKTDPPVGRDDQIWRNCMRVERLEAVFRQRVIHHRRHEKPTRERNVRGAFVLADRVGRRSLHRQERKVIG
jgi:hypothetical protein